MHFRRRPVGHRLGLWNPGDFEGTSLPRVNSRGTYGTDDADAGGRGVLPAYRLCLEGVE